jgi:hypothetical protein
MCIGNGKMTLRSSENETELWQWRICITLLLQLMLLVPPQKLTQDVCDW